MGKAIAISPDESAALSASAGRFLRRSLQSLIGASEAMIPEGGFPGPDEVHDIRVNMKRGRAILKLLRDSPGTDFYKKENSSLRNISSLFSHSRESEVLQKTLKMLAKRHPQVFTPAIVHTITKEAAEVFNIQTEPLSNRAGKLASEGPTEANMKDITGREITTHDSEMDAVPVELDRNDTDAKLAIAEKARELLRRAWYRIGFVDLSGVNRETLLDGLWSSFNRASAAFSATRMTSLPEDAHELRKRSKDLLYQVRFFSDYNPGHFEKVHSRLDDICSVLGKCNDMAVAVDVVSNYYIKTADKEMPKVIETIEREKNQSLELVFQPAHDLFKTFYSGG